MKYFSIPGQAKLPSPTSLAEYLLNKKTLFAENSSRLDFQWGTAAPHPDVPKDHFAMVGTSLFTSQTGWYCVRCTADDGACLELDGEPLIKTEGVPAVRFRAFNSHVVLTYLEQGNHFFRVVYYDQVGPAELAVEIRPVNTPLP